MRRYLLDTRIAGDFINDRGSVRLRVQEEIARGNVVGICVPVLGELYHGAEYSTSRERNLQRLVVAVNQLRVCPYTTDAAAEYGRLAALLQRTGRPMQRIDVQIAVIALTLGRCTVVTAAP